MNGERRQARRYHWLSEDVSSFVDEPHAAIDGPSQGTIVNLTDRRAAPSRDAQLALLREGPDRIVRALPLLQMPAHHDVRPKDVVLRRLHGALAAAADAAPRDFVELLLTPGVGMRTVESLALVAEVVHGAPCRFTDPARFSMAHGGKDGHPFPVPLRAYDRTIAVLRHAIDQAKLGNDERLAAIRRLDAQARRLERVADGVDVDTHVAAERAASPAYDGRTVDRPAARGQLPLFGEKPPTTSSRSRPRSSRGAS
jgi:hypothetical protein